MFTDAIEATGWTWGEIRAMPMSRYWKWMRGRTALAEMRAEAAKRATSGG